MRLKRKEVVEEDSLDLEDQEIDKELEKESLDNSDDSFNDDYLMDEGFGNDLYGDTNNPAMKKHADLLKDLTNFDPFLKKVFHNWLGLQWDDKKSDYVKNPLIRPIMNIKGALWCTNFLDTYARGNNIITHISYDEYKFMVEDMIDVVYFNLGTRHELGIKTNGDLMMICSQLLHAAQLILMGAGDGKYNKLLSTTYTQHTAVNPNTQMQQQPQQMMYQPQRNDHWGKLKGMLLGKGGNS